MTDPTIYSAREIKRGMIIRQGVVMAAFNLPSASEIAAQPNQNISAPAPAPANQNAWKVLITHAGPNRHVPDSEKPNSHNKCPGCTRNTFAYASKLEVYS